MANENELEVIFGADDRQLKKTLGDLQTDLKQFQAQLQKVGDASGLSNLNRQIALTKTNIEKIKNFNIGSDGLTRNVNQSSQAVFAFNQLLRETPAFTYSVQTGILALSNNIPIFVDRINDMRAAGISGGNIIKDLGKSLLSFPSLITIGVSVLTLFADKLFASSRGADAAADKVKELVGSLRSIASITGESSSALGGEIALVNALATTIRNTNLSYTQRENALQRLKSINKAHFGDLTLEAQSLETLTGKVREYTNALVAESIVKAFAEDIGRVNKELFSQNTILDGLKTRLDQAQASLDKFGPDPSKNTNATREESGLIASQTLKYNKLKSAVDDANESFLSQRDVVEKVATNIAELTGALDSAVVNQAKFKPLVARTQAPTFVDGSMEKASNVLRKIVDSLTKQWDEEGEKMADAYYSAWARSISDSQRQRAVIDAFNGTNESIRKGIVGIQARGISSGSVGDIGIKQLDEQGEILARFKELGQNPPDFSYLSDVGAQNFILLQSLQGVTNEMQLMGSIANDFLAPAFNQLFSSLITGSQSAVQAVVSFLKSLVQQIITTIATAAALAAIMSAFGFGAGAGGFGGLFKSFLGGGGRGFGGFSGGAGPSGLALAGASTGGGLSSLNFRLDGNDLVASINRTNTTNGRLGPG